MHRRTSVGAKRERSERVSRYFLVYVYVYVDL